MSRAPRHGGKVRPSPAIHAWFFALVALAGGCRARDANLEVERDAGAAPATSVGVTAKANRGAALVAEACLSCHAEEILRQQRLTPGQWEKVVKKMAGWGANLAADDVPIVTAFLAASYGPDAGAYPTETIAAQVAPNEIVATSDGNFAQGNAARGSALFGSRCAACHGVDARGQIGVNLVDRPLLYRAAEFARTIHTGRAKMPAQPSTTTEEIADLLAFLRGIRSSRAAVPISANEGKGARLGPAAR